jgi:predicted phage tail protein
VKQTWRKDLKAMVKESCCVRCMMWTPVQWCGVLGWGAFSFLLPKLYLSMTVCSQIQLIPPKAARCA